MMVKTDLISRQAVIEINRSYHGQMPNEVNHRIWKEINDLPSAQPEERHGRLPEGCHVLESVDREQREGGEGMIKWRTDEPPRAKEVLVTWENLDPAPYYDFIKGKRFVDEAVWGGSHWYWFDRTIVDKLAEYGELNSLNYGRLDMAIDVKAWAEMPEPYKGGDEE